MTDADADGYRQAVEQMAMAARGGFSALQTAIGRLRLEDERARGGPWDIRR
jgi:hypothetical protein